MSSGMNAPPVSTRAMARKGGIEIQCLYLQMVAFSGVVRVSKLVELVMEVKADYKGTWWSDSERRDYLVTCVG